MINVKTKNNTIIILFLFLSISVFSQKIYTNPQFDYRDIEFIIKQIEKHSLKYIYECL